jgi:hypothetical protein
VSIEELQREALSTSRRVLRCTLDATGDALFATDADMTSWTCRCALPTPAVPAVRTA